MPTHFADELTDRCQACGAPVCVGMDPVFERLPCSLRQGLDPRSPLQAVGAIRAFVEGVLEAVRAHVPCVKFQSACFERYGHEGVRAYHELVSAAAESGLLVIGDAKRGDIGISAAHYAAGCLDDLPLDGGGMLRGPDALTVNPYLGDDALEPFLEVAARSGRGLFVLVRTSNPGGDRLQNLELARGGTVAQAVARMVAEIGASSVGRHGYSLVGAVVGATKPQDAAALRAAMPRQVFLVPGFGAQGGTADDVRACFKPDGTGAIITASRSVLFAYEKTGESDWQGAIERAAIEMKQQVRQALGG